MRQFAFCVAGALLLQLFQSLRLRFVPGCRLRPQFDCVLHVTAGSRIVRAVSKCSWMSLALVISCFASARRQSHCNCNANGVHVSLFLLLTAFIFCFEFDGCAGDFVVLRW